MPTPVAVISGVGRSCWIAGIAGSNPNQGMDVLLLLLSVLCR